MATPRRRRRSVAEIEALANKPTKAKRALPKSRALEKPIAVPKAVRAKAAQRSLRAAMKELGAAYARRLIEGSDKTYPLPKEVKSRIDRDAALVGSGARTYPQAKSPAPKPKRKPAKTVAEIERRANKPTPTSIVPPSPIRLLDRPQPAQLPLPPDLGVFGRTVPKRGVHPRGRTRRRR